MTNSSLFLFIASLLTNLILQRCILRMGYPNSNLRPLNPVGTLKLQHINIVACQICAIPSSLILPWVLAQICNPLAELLYRKLLRSSSNCKGRGSQRIHLILTNRTLKISRWGCLECCLHRLLNKLWQECQLSCRFSYKSDSVLGQHVWNTYSWTEYRFPKLNGEVSFYSCL